MNTLLQEYEKEVVEWMNKVGWRENPFTLKIIPSLFVGYKEQVKKLAHHIKEGHKFALITGATGSGKTTLLKLITEELKNEKKVIYLSKPPKPDEIVDIFTIFLKPSFLQRIFKPKVNLHDLHIFITQKLGNNSLLLLVDEGHEADVETLEWLRTITDQVDNLQLILAGLPSLEDFLRRNLETLRGRITTHIELTNLDQDETRELIRKRVEYVGGTGISPFTDTVVKEIYEITGGFPREILKLCNRLVQKATEEGKIIIDQVEGVEREERISPSRDILRELPYKQRKIIEVLNTEGELFPSEIAEKIGFNSYKTKQHGVRSINNILRRLLEDGYVERKRKGKGYVYSLQTRIKNYMVES